MSDWLPRAVLRMASWFVPGGERAGWLVEWQSELWYIPGGKATAFCLGAFRDALWLRRNNLDPAKPTALESPLKCLAALAAAAAASAALTLCLRGPQSGIWPAQMRVSDLPAGSLVMLLFTCAMMPAMRLAMGRTASGAHPLPWAIRLRGALFLLLKVALVQPVLFAGFFLVVAAGSSVPFLPQLAVFAIWMLTFRWILLDQQRRCPVCLRLLTGRVRIGTPSRTFLDWYGAESVCARGHGLLQLQETPESYSGAHTWLRLDGSWSGLFPERRT